MHMVEGIIQENIDSSIATIKTQEDLKSSIVEVEEASERSTMTKAMIKKPINKSSHTLKIKMTTRRNKKAKRDLKLLNL